MHLPGGLHWESVSGGWCLRSLWKSPETRWGLWGILKEEAHLVSRVSPSADLEGFFFFFFPEPGGLVQPVTLSEWGSLCPDWGLLHLSPWVEWPPV